MSIWKLFGLEKDTTAAPIVGDTETVRKITASLDEMEPDKARFIAAFAYILSRVAHADQHVSPEETHTMERIVMREGHLTEEQAVIVIQIAKTQSTLFGGIEDYIVTQEFNRIATHDEKLALLHCLFAVSAANRSISTPEDNEIRQVSRELKIRHKDFIEARLHYRQHLDVLKKEAATSHPHRKRSKTGDKT